MRRIGNELVGSNTITTHNMILTTFSLACTSLSFRRANTWMCELTCFRVLVLPVRNLMYLAISSLRPVEEEEKEETHGIGLLSVNEIDTNDALLEISC